MDTKEILKRVRRIEIKSRRKANTLFLGEYHSAFKGRGMIFSEVRPYQYGDDVRTIDWNKTAQYNEPFVKVFEEERELTMLLMVDVSGSEYFGTRKQSKRETLAEICATLAFSAITYNDKVGLILFSDEIELFLPPKKGRKHVLRIIRELIHTEPKSKKTDFSQALQYLVNTFKRKANVFVLSDFMDETDYSTNLKIAAKKHDITGFRLYDEKEKDFPNLGWIQAEDSETGQTQWINTNSKSVRQHYKRYFEEMEKKFKQNFSAAGAGQIVLRNDEDYIPPLIQHFHSSYA